jgi:pimeloyl-ACP methyl ester carboxylesterase
MADIGPLPLVRAPTLVMFGKQDQIVPTEAFVHAHHEVDSVSSVIAIPSAGHFIHHEVADFVTGQIGDWIAKPLSYYRDRDRQ